MFPHGFTLQATWTRGERWISPRTATIAWTRVHAITDQNTFGKSRLIGCDRMLTCCHVELSGALDPHRTDGIVIFFHRTADAFRNLSPRDRAIITIHSSELQSDDRDKSWKNPTIAVRSSRDRAAIAQLSSRNRSHRIRRRPTELQDHDRCTIVARSWCDRGKI